MRKTLCILLSLCVVKALQAQTRPPYVYTIKADSVKITNSCDTAELIIENHTQNVPGFLFNKGLGRTEFRRPLQKISDTLYTVGIDTLKLPNAWLQGGNAWGATGILGTKDSNHIAFYTNNTLRGLWTNTGNLVIGDGDADGTKFQVNNYGGISINPNLSAPGDRIQIGGRVNLGDDQNYIIRTTSDYGATYKDVLVERNGNVGLGVSNVPVGWVAGNPAVRVYADGRLSLYSQTVYFGNTVGPENSSALITSISNVNEWLTGHGTYPNRQNSYYFGTMLTGAEDTNVRAPLNIGARELNLMSGNTDAQVLTLNANRNVLIGTTTDNGSKLQVSGNVFADGSAHKIGKLAIVSGQDVANTGFGTGIRIDDHDFGSMMFEGTSQGWAHDMFTFTDAFNGVGQDVQTTDQSIVRIKSGFKYNNIAGNTASVLYINPNYNLDLATSNPLVMRGIYYNPVLTSIVPGSKHIAIETVTGDLLFGTTSGNMGIGTSSPSAQLHTTGTVRFGGLTNNDTLSRIVVSDALGNLYYRNASSLALNDIMNSDLAVNGTLSAQKMKITQTTPWPDYVFSNQYQLPSLKEVEQFIAQNNHLPGIPSAMEVEKKGIDVGNNQAALLKKIEELTLYMIEQEKKLQKQNEEITELKKQNKEIELLKQQMAGLKALIKSSK